MIQSCIYSTVVLKIRLSMSFTNCPQLAQETALQDGQDKRF